MHTRLKQRRWSILAARCEVLAGAAERVIDDLHEFASVGAAPHLAALAVAYARAIADLRGAIRAGQPLPPALHQFESVGRDVVTALADLKAQIPAEIDPPPEPPEAELTCAEATRS